MTAPSAPRHILTADLLARLRSGNGPEGVLHHTAWSLAGLGLPDDIEVLLARGAYLESVIGFSCCWLGKKLDAWRIDYTSIGGPFSARVILAATHGMPPIFESASLGSATRALMAAVIMAGK